MQYCHFPPLDLFDTIIEEVPTKQRRMHIVIAPWAASDKTYLQKHRHAAYRNDDYVILDNGTFEYRKPMPIDEYMHVIDELAPHEVVLPDLHRNNNATVDLSIEAAERIRSSGRHAIRLMGVPQGSSYDDWMNCLQRLIAEARIDVIGFASTVGEHTNSDRIELARQCRLYTDTPIHMLGIDEDLSELPRFVKYADVFGIRSADSGKPISLAFYNGGVKFEDRNEKYHSLLWYPGRPSNYLHRSLKGSQRELAIQNSYAVQKLVDAHLLGYVALT